jgi:hypothetical protein
LREVSNGGWAGMGACVECRVAVVETAGSGRSTRGSLIRRLGRDTCTLALVHAPPGTTSRLLPFVQPPASVATVAPLFFLADDRQAKCRSCHMDDVPVRSAAVVVLKKWLADGIWSRTYKGLMHHQHFFWVQIIGTRRPQKIHCDSQK